MAVERPRYLDHLLKTDRLTAVVERYEPNLRVGVHEHENAYLSIVLSGGYAERCGPTEYVCLPATLTFHPVGERHSNHLAREETRELYVILTRAWNDQLGRLAATRLDWRNPRVTAVAAQIKRELQIGDDLSPIAVESQVNQLLIEATRTGHQAEAPSWLRRVKDHILDDPSPEALAQISGISSRHLARCFQEHFGCTPVAYARHARLENARQLIRANTHSLGEIAAAAGFADQSHFTRAFRHQFGETPGVYARRMSDLG